MSVLNELLEYQKVDGELLAVEQEISKSEERKKFYQAKKFMDTAREKLDAQDRRAVELKEAQAALLARCEQMTKEIAEYSDIDEIVEGGGDVSFYKKNVQSLLDQLRGLKNELNKLTAEIERVIEEYKKFKEQTIAMQKQGAEYQKKYNDLKKSRAGEMKEISDRLAVIAEKIPAEIKAKYDAKRKEKIFPILAPLNGDFCMCGSDFPLAQQSRLSGGNVVECEHCHRFIYKA